MKRYVPPLLILLSYATFAQSQPGKMPLEPVTLTWSYAMDESHLDSILNTLFDQDSVKEYRSIMADPHVMKELRFYAPLPINEFERLVINPPSYDLNTLSEICNEIIKDSLYSSARIGNGLDSIRIRRDDLDMSLKVRLVYEDSKEDRDNHLLIYVGDYTLFDHPVNIWPVTIYPDLNAHGIIIVHYAGNDGRVDFSVKIYVEAHNIGSQWFNIGDTESIADSTMQDIQKHINAIVGPYFRSEKEQR